MSDLLTHHCRRPSSRSTPQQWSGASTDPVQPPCHITFYPIPLRSAKLSRNNHKIANIQYIFKRSFVSILYFLDQWLSFEKKTFKCHPGFNTSNLLNLKVVNLIITVHVSRRIQNAENHIPSRLYYQSAVT